MKIFLLCVLCFCVGLFSGVVISSCKGKQNTRQYRNSKKRKGAAYRRVKQKRNMTTSPIDAGITEEQMVEWKKSGMKLH